MMQRRSLLLFTLITSLIILLLNISCDKKYKEYSYADQTVQYSFQLPSRYEIHNTIDIITFIEITPAEIPGLSDEQQDFYENCPDFPMILISTYPRPEEFDSREEVEEYNREQSEKLGVEFNLIYDFKMLADYITEQEEINNSDYDIINRDTISIAGREGIQIVSSYYYRDETNNLDSEIISYQVFFECENTMWNVHLVAPIFMKDIAVQDFEHIIASFKILD